MKKIEELSVTIDKTKCTYKLYEYEEEAIRKVKEPVEIGEVTLTMGYKITDQKVRVKKYAIHREIEEENSFSEILICETEIYATIISVYKDILKEYIKYLEKLQTP